jgi:Zn-dependent peptidase ImmA (M78 family)
MAKAFKGFPKDHLIIMGQKWDIHYIKGLVSEEGVFGATNEAKRLIIIDADQSIESARDTLVHEAMHAMLHTAGVVDLTDELEERLCRVLAPGLIDLFRNNKIWF